MKTVVAILGRRSYRMTILLWGLGVFLAVVAAALAFVYAVAWWMCWVMEKVDEIDF